MAPNKFFYKIDRSKFLNFWRSLGILVLILALTWLGVLIDKISVFVILIPILVIGLVTLSHPTWLIAGMAIPMVFIIPSPIPGISIERLLAVFLFLFWISRALKEHSKKLLRFPGIILFSMVVFLAVIVLSLVGGVGFSTWLSNGLLFWFNRLFFLVILYELITDKKDILLSMKIVVISAVLLAIWALFAMEYFCNSISALRGSYMVFAACRANLIGGGQITKMLLSLNTHAFSFSIGILFSWALIFNRLKHGKLPDIPLWLWGITGVFSVAIAEYTSSRRGFLFLIICGLYILWTLRKRYKLTWVIAFLVITIAVVFYTINTADPFRLNVTLQELQSGEGARLPYWEVTWYAIQKKPIFGWGAGAPNYAMLDFVGENRTLASTALKILYEMGSVGVIAIIFMLLTLGVYLLRMVGPHREKNGSVPVNSLLPSTIAMFAIFAVSLFAANNLENIFSWYCMGLLLASTKFLERESDEPDSQNYLLLH